MSFSNLKLFTGNSNPQLAQKVAACLKVPLGDALVKKFSDGESFVRINENVRGADVFIIQSTCSPANDNLMELLVMIDALKRASADRITAVIPYYGYARQDRKDSPRTPITARLVADLLESAGIDRVFSLDLHAPQIQGFFNIPFDHLFAAPVLLKSMQTFITGDPADVVLISPDAGGVERTRAYAKRLNCSIAVADKRRDGPGKIAEVNIIGNVQGKEAILLDDIVDTAGTLTMVSKELLSRGATKVWACATHPVLSGPAIERINESPLERLLVTDSIPSQDKQAQCNKLHVLSVSELLADAILRIHQSDSVSSLFV
ncbi:MAG: ribose-phosphate pyrophosphokinase [Deltaproteobacteria bacterium]|nr:ribose-phosphate pyrophosphokinase [Deltaproteobacteria bacterium]